MEIKDLPRGRFRASGRLAASAFMMDPAWVHILPNDADRRRITPAVQEALLKVEVAHGGRPQGAYFEDHLAGMALWFPPGLGPAPLWRWVLRLPEIGAFLARPGAVMRAMRLLEPVDRLRPVDDRIWYLRLLAVDPAQQGLGVGSALLAEGLARADREKRNVYLETFNEKNVSYYGRHGFKLQKKEGGPGGPAFYIMLRPAIS